MWLLLALRRVTKCCAYLLGMSCDVVRSSRSGTQRECECFVLYFGGLGFATC